MLLDRDRNRYGLMSPSVKPDCGVTSACDVMVFLEWETPGGLIVQLHPLALYSGTEMECFAAENKM